MITEVKIGNRLYQANLDEPIDISIPLRTGTENVNAWYSNPVNIVPVRIGDFVGDVNLGGAVNTNDVTLNPHGNGTHTECVGHISKEIISLNSCLKKFHFPALLITLEPEKKGGDRVITAEQLEEKIQVQTPAVIIRTVPNDAGKLTRQYSGTNPPYLESDATGLLVSKDVTHLLIDTPSIDNENDKTVKSHHIFWNYPDSPRKDATISELIYVADNIEDGLYLLNLQITALENDASPSKPVIYFLSER